MNVLRPTSYVLRHGSRSGFRRRTWDVGRRTWDVGRRTPRRGFTLLELILTMALVAMIMSLIYGIVTSTVRNAHRIEQIMQGAEVGPAILAQIREDLEGAIILDAKAEQFVGLDRKANAGDRDRLDFITTTMTYDRESETDEARFQGLNEVGYQVKDNPDDANLGILYRRIDPFVDGDPLQGGRLVELYDRVRVFNVEYHDPDEKEPTKTANTWNSKEKEGELPRAIRIELVIVVSAGQEGKPEERKFVLTVTRAR